MVEKSNIVLVDWRKYGDFSAVGQLTKKIFSEVKQVDVYPIQVLDDFQKCRLFKKQKNGEAKEIVSWPIFQDSALNEIKKIQPVAIYVRLSPHKPTLEFSCKLAVVFPSVPLIVHFMDTPHLTGLRPSTAKYILSMYQFLMKKAERVYTIHDSSISWIKEQYHKSPYVLSNFVKYSKAIDPIETLVKKNKIQISYFGSVDKKMNALALGTFAKEVADLDWVEFSVWSNSGVWGDLKEASEAYDNITVRKSNLSESEFQEQMGKADFLLLPYNMDEDSVEFLKHSFSNKLIDYIESGRRILCLGSFKIPTVKECDDYKLALVISSDKELSNVFSSRKNLNKLCLEQYSMNFESNIEALALSKKAALTSFINYIENITSTDTTDSLNNKLGKLEYPHTNKYLSSLIRRKFFDAQINRQSLFATISANLLKKKGYKGFDYEI